MHIWVMDCWSILKTSQWKFYCYQKIIVVSHIQVCKCLHNLQLFASVLHVLQARLFSKCSSINFLEDASHSLPYLSPFLFSVAFHRILPWSHGLFICFMSEKNHPQTLIKFYKNDSASPSRCEFSYQNKTGSD